MIRITVPSQRYNGARSVNTLLSPLPGSLPCGIMGKGGGEKFFSPRDTFLVFKRAHAHAGKNPRKICVVCYKCEILEKEQKRVKKRKSTSSASGKRSDVKPERSEFISGLMADRFPDTMGELFSFVLIRCSGVQVTGALSSSDVSIGYGRAARASIMLFL